MDRAAPLAMNLSRRAALGLAAANLPFLAGPGRAQQLFRIGTGGPAGTYYPVGSAIARAVSQPGRLTVTAQPSSGSVANVQAVAAGAIESGFAQSDIATWAQTGTGLFQGRQALPGLRLIASLYAEHMHLVVRRGSGIRSVADLAGRRVAMDEPGSGTLVHARLVLAAWNVREVDLRPDYIKPDAAAQKLREGTLDAFFLVGGAPAPVITGLLGDGTGIELVPLAGAPAEGLRQASNFFAVSDIPASTYAGQPAVRTLAVGAQWITRADVDAETVYQLTRALFADASRRALQDAHPRARQISAAGAVLHAGIPFHAGAERYYREQGLLRT